MVPNTDEKNTQPQFAVLYPRSVNAAEAFKRTVAAGGLPLRYGFLSNLVVASSKVKNFPRAVKDYGALLVFDPVIKGSCIINDQSLMKVSGKPTLLDNHPAQR